MTSCVNRLAFLLACGTALSLGVRPALASSELIQGTFIETDPAGASYHGAGVCSFVTGPRDGLGADQFVLTVGDQDPTYSGTLRVTGSYTAATTRNGGQGFTLSPDARAAARYVQDVLRKQLKDPRATFRLDSLDAAAQTVFPGKLQCSVNLTGQVTSSVAAPAEVSMSFAREGIFYPGYAAPGRTQKPVPAPVAAEAAGPCPTRDPNNLNGSLAPLGLAPVPAQCDTAQCLVDFKGYRWWTSFQYYGPEGGFFPHGGYFYNGGLATRFAPKNAFVDAEGKLHLLIAMRDLGAGPVVAGSEVVLMFNKDGSEANLGYGDYLVSATIRTAPSWGELDPNAAFGVFTYERIGTGSGGPPVNPNREIDLAELSRWGWNHTGKCPFDGNELPLCQGNAQFTLQPWNSTPQNLHRYSTGTGAKHVTLVMRWHGPNQPVTFDQYDGGYNFSNLPASPNETWTTPSDQNQYVPATHCERFHLNLWMGNYKRQKDGVNPPPATLPQEVVVSNFQFRPAP